MINLTGDERHKLSMWLMQEARAQEVLIAQMKKAAVPQAMLNMKLAEAAAMKLVARRLDATQADEIG